MSVIENVMVNKKYYAVGYDESICRWNIYACKSREEAFNDFGCDFVSDDFDKAESYADFKNDIE